jgi:glycine/D-amino acid oxidase-like deaminating enzyme
MRQNLQLRSHHAVVIGGSIAGLCAAHVLSDHFDRVTIYERDELPDEPVNRSAIPQGLHVHLLTARGAQEPFGQHRIRLGGGSADPAVERTEPRLSAPAE